MPQEKQDRDPLEELEARMLAAVNAVEERAAKAEARALEAEAKLIEAQDASNRVSSDRLAAALEALAGGQGAARPGMTFRPGETVAAVDDSLEGSLVDDPIPDEFLLEAPVKFESKGRGFYAIQKSRNRLTMPNGETFVTKGIIHDFRPDGRFETRDARVADYLRRRPYFNTQIYEVGKEPDRIPSPEVMLDRITAATLDLDDSVLGQIESEERAGFKREAVMLAVASARRQVRETLEQQEALAQ